MTTAVSALDTTIQKTIVWLDEITERLTVLDRRRAYLVLRTTLHTLRDALPVNEAIELGAQLPMLIRGLYYEGWKPSKTPSRERTKQEFLGHIGRAFPAAGELFPERAARAVFKVLAKHISQGERDEIAHLLPKKIRPLWPTIRVTPAWVTGGRSDATRSEP
jgi:uncharacterized protein (DUF2267 family)